MGFKINFKLRNINDIIPFGNEHDYMSWFVLTDSLLWIEAGENTIYEYSQKAIELWNCVDIKYNDYQLSRFLEDFSILFQSVREPVPKYLFDIIEDFARLADIWQTAHYDDPDNIYEAFFDNEYMPLTEWFYSRLLDSGHLVGGPDIGFFRYDNKIKIYWKGNYILEDGTSIWTSPQGIFEIDYKDFVSEVVRFFDSFFLAMDQQVQLALEKDWVKVHLDKEYLIKEHRDRRNNFYAYIGLLSQKTAKGTDWKKISNLYDKMLLDISASKIEPK